MGKPITSVLEFEAIIDQAILRLDKHLYAKPDPTVADARRSLQKIRALSKDNEKVKAQRETMQKISDTITEKLTGDPELHNDMWDLLDYIDYRC